MLRSLVPRAERLCPNLDLSVRTRTQERLLFVQSVADYPAVRLRSLMKAGWQNACAMGAMLL
jgi:hypothetical protein